MSCPPRKILQRPTSKKQHQQPKSTTKGHYYDGRGASNVNVQPSQSNAQGPRRTGVKFLRQPATTNLQRLEDLPPNKPVKPKYTPIVWDGASTPTPVVRNSSSKSTPAVRDSFRKSTPVVRGGFSNSTPIVRDGFSKCTPIVWDGVSTPTPVVRDSFSKSTPVVRGGVRKTKPVTKPAEKVDRKKVGESREGSDWWYDSDSDDGINIII